MFRTFRSSIAALVVTASLTSSAFAAPGRSCYFGECSAVAVAPAAVSAPASTVSSEFRRIAGHGTWTAMSDGQATLVVDTFNDGSKFAIADYGNGKGGLIFSRPSWQMTKGQTYTMKIDVDGQSFTGTVIASNAMTLLLDDVTTAFVSAIYNGRKGEIRIGDFSADMTTLADAGATMHEAVLYQQTSAR